MKSLCQISKYGDYGFLEFCPCELKHSYVHANAYKLLVGNPSGSPEEATLQMQSVPSLNGTRRTPVALATALGSRL